MKVERSRLQVLIADMQHDEAAIADLRVLLITMAVHRIAGCTAAQLELIARRESVALDELIVNDR